MLLLLPGTVKDDADIAVSTMGVTFLISSFLYMFPMAAGTSVNTRIANELGAGATAAPTSPGSWVFTPCLAL